MRSLWLWAAVLGITVSLPASAARHHSHHAKAKHHCVKDGDTVDGIRSSKACKKAHGKWVKDTDDQSGFLDKQ